MWIGCTTADSSTGSDPISRSPHSHSLHWANPVCWQIPILQYHANTRQPACDAVPLWRSCPILR